MTPIPYRGFTLTPECSDSGEWWRCRIESSIGADAMFGRWTNTRAGAIFWVMVTLDRIIDAEVDEVMERAKAGKA